MLKDENPGISKYRLQGIDRNAPWWPANYGAGTWAFVIHRATGLALVGYLFLHLLVVSFAAVAWGGVSFDQLMAFFNTPVIKVMELGLILLVLVHGANGIRILLFDAGIGIRHQRVLFWVALTVALLVWALACVFTINHIMSPKLGSH